MSFFIDHLRWLLLVTAISRRYSEKYLLQNSKGNMLRNSDIRNHSGCLLQNFRTATFENNFGGLLLKRKPRNRRMRNYPFAFKFLLFPGHLFISHKTKFLLFPGHLFIKSWNNLLSSLIFVQWSLSIWTMSSVFVNLRKSLVVQFLPSRF